MPGWDTDGTRTSDEWPTHQSIRRGASCVLLQAVSLTDVMNERDLVGMWSAGTTRADLSSFIKEKKILCQGFY